MLNAALQLTQARRPATLKLRAPGVRAEWVRVCSALLTGVSDAAAWDSKRGSLPNLYSQSAFEDSDTLNKAFSELRS